MSKKILLTLEITEELAAHIKAGNKHGDIINNTITGLSINRKGIKDIFFDSN